MGKLSNGILGGVSGKIAKIVGYELNGQNVIRTIGVNNKPPSKKQLNNRQQMKVIMEFLSPMQTLLKTGFSPKAKNSVKNFHNLAIFYNKPHALKGYYPDVEIDYSKFIFSVGSLSPVINPRFFISEKYVEFIWDMAPSNDQVMLLAYAPGTKIMTFKNSGARRSEGSDKLMLKPKMQGVHLELYISFVSDDRENVTDSLYLGSFVR